MIHIFCAMIHDIIIFNCFEVEFRNFGYLFQNQYWRSISHVYHFCKLVFS